MDYATFCPHVPARLVGIARRRLRHRPHLQVFETDNRVVLADCVRRLEQEVFADVADAAKRRVLRCCSPFGMRSLLRVFLNDRTPAASAPYIYHLSVTPLKNGDIRRVG